MSASRRGLLLAVVAAALVLVPAQLISDEVWQRVLDHTDLVQGDGLATILLVVGAEYLALGALVVLVCRSLALRLGSSRGAALGAGLVVASGVFAGGLHTLAAAGLHAVSAWPDHVELFTWNNRLDTVTRLSVLLAGLVIAGVRRRSAVVAVLLVLLAGVVIGQTWRDPVGYPTYSEIRDWVVLVVAPILAGLAVVVLADEPARQPTEEPASASV
jgi:hypothetical protein